MTRDIVDLSSKPNQRVLFPTISAATKYFLDFQILSNNLLENSAYNGVVKVTDLSDYAEYSENGIFDTTTSDLESLDLASADEIFLILLGIFRGQILHSTSNCICLLIKEFKHTSSMHHITCTMSEFMKFSKRNNVMKSLGEKSKSVKWIRICDSSELYITFNLMSYYSKRTGKVKFTQELLSILKRVPTWQRNFGKIGQSEAEKFLGSVSQAKQANTFPYPVDQNNNMYSKNNLKLTGKIPRIAGKYLSGAREFRPSPKMEKISYA